jgi:hypothetical protein
MKNIEELKLSKESAQGKAYLRLDRLSVDEIPRESGAQVESETMKEDTETESETAKPVAKEQIQEIVKPHVFISHSKNKKILEQIKEMLKFGNFDYEIAEERETTSIPIPDKIFGLMCACNCANESALFILRNQKMQVRDANRNLVELYKRNLAMLWTQTVVNKLL